MDAWTDDDLSGFCLFVTSTFGNGDPPTMAEQMADWLDKKVIQHKEEKFAEVYKARKESLQPMMDTIAEEPKKQPLSRQVSKCALTRTKSTRHSIKAMGRKRTSSKIQDLNVLR